MTIFWINLSFVYFFSFLSRYFSEPSVSGSDFIRPNKFFVFVVMISLIMVSGLRINIGDTFFYMFEYANHDINWDYITTHKDMGFGIFQMILQEISSDPQILIFSAAIITNTLIVLVLFKYSRLFELSLFIFIASGMYLTSMNGVRQYIAAAIIFLSTKFLFEGKFFKFLLIILLAATFHLSALIFIPIYFIVRNKAWTSSTFILIILAIVFVIAFNQLSSLLFSLIQNTQYGDYRNFSEGGANFARVIINSVPLILAYFGRERLRELNKYSDIIVNLALFGVIFMLIATQNWIFARFSIYFGLYNLILISWLVKVFDSKSQRFIYFSIIIFYFSFYYYENVIILGTDYKSNFFLNFLFNFVR